MSQRLDDALDKAIAAFWSSLFSDFELNDYRAPKLTLDTLSNVATLCARETLLQIPYIPALTEPASVEATTAWAGKALGAAHLAKAFSVHGLGFTTSLSPRAFEYVSNCTISPDCPPWVAAALPGLYASLWGLLPNVDTRRALAYLRLLSPSDSCIHHSGGGFMHAIAVVHRDERWYVFSTCAEFVAVHPLPRSMSALEAWEYAMDDLHDAPAALAEIA